MTAARETAVSDSGPLMALAKIGRLSLLRQLFARIYVPETVEIEVVQQGLVRGRHDAVTVQALLANGELTLLPLPRTMPSAISDLPLGAGEKSAITLALEMRVELLCDDGLARSAAQQMGLKVRGTLGVLVAAYRADLLSLRDVEIGFDAIKTHPDIWIADSLCDAVLAALPDGRSS